MFVRRANLVRWRGGINNSLLGVTDILSLVCYIAKWTPPTYAHMSLSLTKYIRRIAALQP